MIPELIPEILVGVVVVAAIGVPAIIAALLIEAMRDKGRRCVSPRTGPYWSRVRAELARFAGLLAALAVRLWERLDTFELPAPGINYPAAWDRVHAPAPRRPVNGRYLGTQPRLTPYPTAADPVTPLATDDAPPWSITTTQQPALDEPAYGVDRCEADVDEAGRHFALAMGPDGCEET